MVSINIQMAFSSVDYRNLRRTIVNLVDGTIMVEMEDGIQRTIPLNQITQIETYPCPPRVVDHGSQ